MFTKGKQSHLKNPGVDLKPELTKGHGGLNSTGSALYLGNRPWPRVICLVSWTEVN